MYIPDESQKKLLALNKTAEKGLKYGVGILLGISVFYVGTAVVYDYKKSKSKNYGTNWLCKTHLPESQYGETGEQLNWSGLKQRV